MEGARDLNTFGAPHGRSGVRLGPILGMVSCRWGHTDRVHLGSLGVWGV